MNTDKKINFKKVYTKHYTSKATPIGLKPGYIDENTKPSLTDVSIDYAKPPAFYIKETTEYGVFKISLIKYIYLTLFERMTDKKILEKYKTG